MSPRIEDLKAIWRDLYAHVDRLAAERQRHMDFFQQALEAHLVSDVHGVIEEVNGATVDLLQRRRLTLHGKPIATLVAPEERREFRRRLREIQAAPAAWRAMLAIRGRRIAVDIAARAMASERICWRLRPAQ
jgi:PAS domain-containing protein